MRALQPVLLFCEDEAAIRKLIRHGLAGRYRVELAKNGEEGLQLAAELRPDAIFTDVAMPVMDGFTFALELSARPALRRIPLAFLTASAHRAAVARFRPARSTAYLMKPFSVAQLRHAVERILDQSREEAER